MDAAPHPISMTRRIIASAVVIVLALVLAAFGFRSLASLRKQSARTATVAPAPLVRAEQVHRLDFQETLRGYGRALPLRRARVVAEVPGVVREISPLLEAGSAIRREPTAGTAEAAALPVLVRLDDRDLIDLLARAEAEVEMASAERARLAINRKSLEERLAVADEELDNATRELRRISGLVPKTLTQSDLDAQRMQVTTRQNLRLTITALIADNEASQVAATAALDVRTRAVALARRELERAVIRAPFAGRIESRQVNVGERVRVGDPLFSILDLGRVEVPVALPARRFQDVRPGAPATARLPGTDDVLWTGTVSRVAPAINRDDRTFFAYVVIEGSPVDNPAPPGAHLLIEVEGRLHPGVVPVPRRAFLGDRVFVARPIGEGGEALVEERTPTVARLLPGQALVSAGLEDGEFVLVTNIESVAEGSRVRLAPALETRPAKPVGAVSDGAAEGR